MKRLLFVDNLRIFLTALVVLHHLSLTYGAPGSWYYNETEAGLPEIVPMILFVASNQSFFMGMFFLISAFFMVPSLERKGTTRFLKERLLRLGIPMLVFYFLISPLTIFLLVKFIRGEQISFFRFMAESRGQNIGPMWFVLALLLFSLIYLLMQRFRRPERQRRPLPLPGVVPVLLFALLTGIGQYLIRIRLPVGWSMPLTNFQFPFFLQYILWFIIGVVAWRNQWMTAITPRMGWRWFTLAQIMIFVGMPLLLFLGNVFETGTEPVAGGGTWQSLGYAVWEQITGISLMIGLFGIFQSRFNRQGKLLEHLSASAYTVYIIHPLVLVALCLLIRDLSMNPLLKFMVAAPFALAACFLTAWVIRRLPLAKKIL